MAKPPAPLTFKPVKPRPPSAAPRGGYTVPRKSGVPEWARHEFKALYWFCLKEAYGSEQLFNEAMWKLDYRKVPAAVALLESRCPGLMEECKYKVDGVIKDWKPVRGRASVYAGRWKQENPMQSKPSFSNNVAEWDKTFGKKKHTLAQAKAWWNARGVA